MKKFFIIMTGIMLLLSGCNFIGNSAQANQSEEKRQGIPFLTYYKSNDGKSVSAKLSYWNLEKSSVTFTNTEVYTALLNNANIVEPIMWDGNKTLALFKNSSVSDDYKDNAKVINDYRMDTIYGRDIEAKKKSEKDNPQKNKDYNLYLNTGNGIIEKKVALLYNTKDEEKKEIVIGEEDIPSYIDFNNKTGRITFIFKYFFKNYSSLYVARFDKDNIEKIDWQEIKLSKDIQTGGGLTPYPHNSALIGNKYYIQSSLSFAEIDLEKKKSKLLDDVNKTCRSIVKEENFIPDYPKEIMPYGIYEDILILKVPVSGESGMEYLLCAFKDNIFQGAIHLRLNDKWSIIDKNKKVQQEFLLSNKKLFKRFDIDFLYFPFYGV